MKQLIYSAGLLFAVLFISACGAPTGEKAKVGEAQEAEVVTEKSVLTVDLEKSSIQWEGSKPLGKHDGIVKLSQGEVHLVDGKLTGGEFLIDLTTIENHDLEDPAFRAKLEDHLKSADFFDVEKFPTARFTITGIESSADQPDGFIIAGNLLMKGIEKGIRFPANIHYHGGGLHATAPAFTIDRAEWNVQYGSKKFFDNLKDNFVHDEISLELELIANP